MPPRKPQLAGLHEFYCAAIVVGVPLSDLPSAAFILCGYLAAVALAAVLARSPLFPPPDPGRRIGTIDGLRGYLALGVFFHHYTLWEEVLHGRPWDGLGSNLLNNLGQSSVAIFFMITGTLFYRIVGRKGLSTNWLSLYISRAFRLMPMLWVVTALVALYVLAHGGHPSLSDLAPIARWLTFVGNPDFFGYANARLVNAGVLWTLKYEVAFYVTLPLVALALNFVRVRWMRIAGLTAITVTLLATYDASAFEFQAGLLAFFPMGMIAAELADIAPNLLCSRSAALVGVAALATQMLAMHGAYAPLPALLLLVAFIPVVAGNSYFGLLTRPSSVVLGEVSYSIYMLHGIVLTVLMSDIVPHLAVDPNLWWFALPLVAAAVVAIAAMSFLVIERPFIRLGHKLGRRSVKPKVVPEPSPAS